MQKREYASAFFAGLALFSMFFGAGDIIWPLILGAETQSQVTASALGLIVTGVFLPLLGLVAMLLFYGEVGAFFGRLGTKVGLALLFIIQLILGPIGSLPRLITLSYASLKDYLPPISLWVFSLILAGVYLGFSYFKGRVIHLLGYLLTPLLLLCMAAILWMGLSTPATPPLSRFTPSESFFRGLTVGYNTLDMIAAFIFAPLVMGHFLNKDRSSLQLRSAAKKMFLASLIAAGILCLMYLGLTRVSALHSHQIATVHLAEQKLQMLAYQLLGAKGALIAALAIFLACLTTAIPLISIFADYLQKDLLKSRIPRSLALIVTLGMAATLANLGFMGIADILSPILQILCPGLIVLSVLNILHRLYEMHLTKMPVYAAFGISTLGYFVW